MATIRKVFEQQLWERGLSATEAAEIVRRTEAAEENGAMRGRWDEDESDYPAALISVVWLAVKRAALAWIDETCPQAWFRPLFDGSVDRAPNDA